MQESGKCRGGFVDPLHMQWTIKITKMAVDVAPVVL